MDDDLAAVEYVHLPPAAGVAAYREAGAGHGLRGASGGRRGDRQPPAVADGDVAVGTAARDVRVGALPFGASAGRTATRQLESASDATFALAVNRQDALALAAVAAHGDEQQRVVVHALHQRAAVQRQAALAAAAGTAAADVDVAVAAGELQR